MFGDDVIALAIKFNDQVIWGAKLYMDAEQAIIMDKNGDLYSALPHLIVDEITHSERAKGRKRQQPPHCGL